MLKDFSKYAFSNIFIKATSFIIPLILAYYYTEAEYGEISLGYTYINFFSMFFAFGFCESIQRFYSNIKELNEKDILGNVFVFDLILVFFFSVFFLLISNYICKLSKDVFFLLLLIGYMKAFQNMGLSILQMEQDSTKYVIISFVTVVIDLLLILFFVVIIRLPVSFRFISLVICNIVSTIILFFYIHNYISKPKKFFSKKFVEILRFAVPCMLLPIMSWLITMSDKVVISRLNTLSNLGIYSFCFTISQIPSILFQAFNIAFTPVFYSQYNNKEKIKSIKTLFIKIYALINLLFIIFCQLFFSYTDVFDKYEEGLVFMPYFLIFSFFSAVSSMNNAHLIYVYKTKIILCLTSISGIFTFVLNYIFIENFGTKGSAISLVLSMAIQMTLSFIFSIKYGYFSWKRMDFLLTFSIYVIALLFLQHKIIFFVMAFIFCLYVVFSEFNKIRYLRVKHD